jgi:hypothetical protein
VLGLVIALALVWLIPVAWTSWWTSYRKIAMPLPGRPSRRSRSSQTMMTIPAGIGTVVSGVGIVNALQVAWAWPGPA